MNLIKFWVFRDQTPPTTPDRVRSSAQQNERDQRFLDSPIHHRTPYRVRMAQLGDAVPPIPAPVFVAPPVVPPPAPVYSHLPGFLTERYAALPPLVQHGRGRGRGRGRGIVAAPLPFSEIAAQYAALPHVCFFVGI